MNFGNDVPANLLGSIVLVDTPALDGQLQTHDGQSVSLRSMAAATWLAPCGSDRGHPHSSGERGGGSCRGRGDLHLFDDVVAADEARRRRGRQRENTLTGVTFRSPTVRPTPPRSPSTSRSSTTCRGDGGRSITVAEDTAIPFSTALANDLFGADGVDLGTGVAMTTAPPRGWCLQRRRHLHVHGDGGPDGPERSSTRSPTGTATPRRRR